jgi:hypothetical protein
VRVLGKTFKATASRKTRFHTERGELMETAAWAALPRAIARRVGGNQPAEPWIVPHAVKHLERVIRPDWQVLELGSGASTAWYAARAGSVLSLEDDPNWYRQIVSQLHGTSATVELMPLERMIARVEATRDQSFDLVVVDANQNASVTRVDLARAALAKVKPGGLLLFDDFDSDIYRPADALFEGWEAQRFTGIKGHPMTAIETSIFTRPS